MARMSLACGLCLLLTASGATALEICAAARAGDLARVTALIEADPALVAARSASAKTPLIYAAWFGHAEVIARLLAHGADPNLVSDAATTRWTWRSCGDSPRSSACSRPRAPCRR